MDYLQVGLNKASQNTSVSAVLFFKNLNSYVLDRSEASLWHNPFAKYPIANNTFPFDEFSFLENGDRLDIIISRKEKKIIDLLEVEKERYLFCKADKPLDD